MHLERGVSGDNAPAIRIPPGQAVGGAFRMHAVEVQLPGQLLVEGRIRGIGHLDSPRLGKRDLYGRNPAVSLANLTSESSGGPFSREARQSDGPESPAPGGSAQPRLSSAAR